MAALGRKVGTCLISAVSGRHMKAAGFSYMD